MNVMIVILGMLRFGFSICGPKFIMIVQPPTPNRTAAHASKIPRVPPKSRLSLLKSWFISHLPRPRMINESSTISRIEVTMFCTFAEVFRSSRFSRKNNVTMMQAAALVLMPVKMLVRYVPKATPIYACAKAAKIWQ